MTGVAMVAVFRCTAGSHCQRSIISAAMHWASRLRERAHRPIAVSNLDLLRARSQRVPSPIRPASPAGVRLPRSIREVPTKGTIPRRPIAGRCD